MPEATAPIEREPSEGRGQEGSAHAGPSEAPALDPRFLDCQGLVKRFGATTALDDVSLCCPEASILVLLGPSGCGKTTLLRCIAGLEQPSSGRIAIAGRDVTGVLAQQRGVAMVFQNYALYPDKTAAENITFPLRMAKVPRAQQRERLAAIASLLRLDELLDRRPGQLSGGQKQRVGIGRALARGPRVLLMDEPLSNLDAQLRVEMRAEILKLQQALGITVVYVTHDQTEAMTLGHHIVVMREGRVEQTGTPEAAFERPASSFVAGFLGAMNLVPVGGSYCRLPKHAGPELAGATVGVRPERLERGEPGDADFGFRGQVELVELLGTERLVHLREGDVRLRMRDTAQASIGEQLTVRARGEDLHYFSADDGRRLDGHRT
jgi:ABC-type sugar transport system ATPase subunit